MPSIIDYPVVLQQMQSQGFKSLYHNSGAFALPQQPPPQVLAWIGPPDASIRAEALPLVRRIKDPHELTLANMAEWLWSRQLSGVVWLMPMSHWAFECGQEWMPGLLSFMNIDSVSLGYRNDASAIQFVEAENQLFVAALAYLFEKLIASDFALAFPSHQTLCTVHHHKQLWWSTQNAEVLTALESLATQFAAS